MPLTSAQSAKTITNNNLQQETTISDRILNILLVEDSQPDALLIKFYLAESNHSLKSSLQIEYNLKSALKYATNHEINIVLLDLNLPDSKGFDTFIKFQASYPDTAIIILTGDDNDIIVNQAMKYGAQDYLVKGDFNQKILSRSIRYSIERMTSKMRLEALNEELDRKVMARTLLLEKEKEKVEFQNREIKQNMAYAKQIQNAFQSKEYQVINHINDLFILDSPQNIVSGDFFFYDYTNDKLTMAVGDCTGHGVSGALLSIMAVTLLNHITREQKVQTTSEILAELSQQVKGLLSNGSNSHWLLDGMDIGLCILDLKTKKLQYSGAKRPLYHFRNGKLTIYKGDKLSIGCDLKHATYTATTFTLKDKDTFYLFSDGFADQFGGPNNKKLKIRNFNYILQKIHADNMNDQKGFLEEYLEQWKGKFDQTDDIMVVGWRV